MNTKGKESDKRLRLLKATEEVFSKRGYAQTTLDEIIGLADTGKGTLYKYFGNKDNLFYNLVHLKHKELMDKMWPVAKETSLSIEEKLTKILTLWIKFLFNHTVLWQVLLFEMTGTNRGYLAVKGEDGELRLTTSWGTLPPESEREVILRYHRLLWEEPEPIVKVYGDGVKQGFFRDSGQSMDIPENIFYTAAMVVFFNRGQHMSDGMTAEELAEKFASHQLYGLAADKKRTPDIKYWHLIAEHEESYGYGPGEEEKTEGKIVFL